MFLKVIFVKLKKKKVRLRMGREREREREKFRSREFAVEVIETRHANRTPPVTGEKSPEKKRTEVKTTKN